MQNKPLKFRLWSWLKIVRPSTYAAKPLKSKYNYPNWCKILQSKNDFNPCQFDGFNLWSYSWYFYLTLLSLYEYIVRLILPSFIPLRAPSELFESPESYFTSLFFQTGRGTSHSQLRVRQVKHGIEIISLEPWVAWKCAAREKQRRKKELSTSIYFSRVSEEEQLLQPWLSHFLAWKSR